MEIKNPLKRGKERFECNQGQDGKIACKSFRENKDGTTEELANMDFEVTGDCQAVPTHLSENEDGALEKLEKKAVPRIRDKCNNRPSDY